MIEVFGYYNSYLCGNKSDRKCTVVFLMCGVPTSSCSKKKLMVVLSLCEIKYIALSMRAC